MTVKEEIEQMQSYLEITPSGDANEYIERLQTLGVYLARSGTLLAQAKMDLNYKQTQFYESHAEYLKNFTASQAKDYLKARCFEEQYVVDRLDRINSACVHQSDSIRTLISYAKEEMRIAKTGY